MKNKIDNLVVFIQAVYINGEGQMARSHNALKSKWKMKYLLKI